MSGFIIAFKPCLYCKINMVDVPAKYCSIECNFWHKIDKNGPDDCWEWKGYRNSSRYGVIRLSPYPAIRAHRFSFEIHKGYPGKLLIYHSCDNPPCCNPKHLFSGTAQDNTNDAKSKNRTRGASSARMTGSLNPAAKLNEEIVRNIFIYRKNGLRRSEIAENLNISVSSVDEVIYGRRWTHVSILDGDEL